MQKTNNLICNHAINHLQKELFFLLSTKGIFKEYQKQLALIYTCVQRSNRKLTIQLMSKENKIEIMVDNVK